MKKKLLKSLALIFSMASICLCFAAGCGKEETAHTEHVWGEYSITQPPTCTETGKQTRACTICGETQEKLVAAFGHDYDEGKVTKPATCENEGELVKTCKNDATHTKASVIPALGHDWAVKEILKPATCTEKGEQLMYCKNDESHTKTMEIAPGHTWGDWEWISESDCVTNGKRKRTCSVCRESEEEIVYATGHKWTDWVREQEPDCTTDGLRVRSCKTCKLKEEVVLPALGHDWKFTVQVEASQDAEGREVGECANCKETCERTIPPLSEPRGIYRIVVSKTSGRQIVTWKEGDDGLNYRFYKDGKTSVYYTTKITLKNSRGEIFYQGNLIARTEDGEEAEPHLELELPIDDYTVILDDIPEGYIYQESYQIERNSFVKIMPDGQGGETKTADPKLSENTFATDPVDLYGNAIENGTEKKISGSLTIVLTSKASEGELPAMYEPSVDGKIGGIFKGAILPDCSFETVNGETIKFSDLLEEKQLVVLDVYYYNCPYCRLAAPDFAAFARRFKNEIAVICLNTSDSSPAIAEKIYDPNDVYNYPDWFYCVMDYANQFFMNIENSGGLSAPTQVVIDRGFCVADVFGYTSKAGERIFRCLPDGFNRDFDREMSGSAVVTVSRLPVILPEKKQLFI